MGEKVTVGTERLYVARIEEYEHLDVSQDLFLSCSTVEKMLSCLLVHNLIHKWWKDEKRGVYVIKIHYYVGDYGSIKFMESDFNPKNWKKSDLHEVLLQSATMLWSCAKGDAEYYKNHKEAIR